MGVVVQKYGGSSVSSVERLQQVARLVVEKKRAGSDVVVVVSAMGDTTDELLARAKAISKEPDRRELDMLLSAGERISMALLAMAIRELGLEAVSLTGSQSGIITNASHAQARIIEVRPFRIQDELAAGRIAIVAGYQGVSYRRDITTLGRGGSDTTAVALAAALDAEACEIYSDVAGVYSADPRVVAEPKKLDGLGYQEMQELAEAGARVLNADAVEFAKRHGIAIYARKTGSADLGTVIRKDLPTPPSGVRAIAHQLRVGAIEAALGAERLSAFVVELGALGARMKQVAYTAPRFSAVIDLDDLHREPSLRAALERNGGTLRLDCGAVSLIGDGAGKDPALLPRALGVLERERIAFSGVSTSSFRITVLVPTPDVERAVRALHTSFDLAAPSTEARILE
jgi:aspartate kinase